MTRTQLREDIAQGGHVVVNGHTVTKPLVESIESIDLVHQPRPGTGPVQIVQISPRANAKPRKELVALKETYAEDGAVHMESVRLAVPWAQAKEYHVRPQELFAPTLSWVRDNIEKAGPGAAPMPDGTPPDTEGAVRGCERILTIPIENKQTWNVLHVPENYQQGRPALVFLSIASGCRAANARFYVRIARRLGEKGWASLRVDPRGVGDSEGDLERATIQEVHMHIQNGLLIPDTQAAIDALQKELGPCPVILAGLCGGAITAVYQAAADSRVAAVAALELPVRYSLDPESTVVPGKSLRGALVKALRSKRTPFTVAARRRLLRWRRHYRRFKHAANQPSGGTSAQMVKRLAMRLGERANTRVFAALLECIERQLPVKCVFAGTYNAQAFASVERDVRSAYGDAAGRLHNHVIIEADHLFSDPRHTDDVIRLLSEWLADPSQPWADSSR